MPAQDVRDFIRGKSKINPKEITTTLTLMREGISPSVLNLDGLSESDLEFALAHSKELKVITELTNFRERFSKGPCFNVAQAIELMKVDIKLSEFMEVHKLIDKLADYFWRHEYFISKGYSSAFDTVIAILKEGITVKQTDDAIIFIEQGFDPKTTAILIKEGVKVSQLADVKDLLTLGIPLKDIPNLLASEEGARIIIERALQGAILKDITPDQMSIIKKSPNKTIMAYLIGKGLIDIKNPDEVKAAQYVGFVREGFGVFDNNDYFPSDYDSINDLVSSFKNDASHFAPFEEKFFFDEKTGKDLPFLSNINYLWDKEPRRLNALHERLSSMGPEEQAYLVKNHPITAKNAAQGILSINPFNIDQSFRVEHLLIESRQEV
ncbi:MAG: hypothetical protein JSS34_06060 [Proteobacteria bacterium]|nr:hypothetical protein [Pseudomonadota bacterium]